MSLKSFAKKLREAFPSKRQAAFAKLGMAGASDFIARHPERGASFHHPGSDLRFFTITDCLCAGEPGQVIMPLGAALEPLCVLDESYNQDHGPQRHMRDLEHFPEIRWEEFDEAAPLYPLWGDNLWHWTFECLPKLLALEEQGYSGTYIVPDVVYINESLALFGVEAKRVARPPGPYRIRRMTLGERVYSETLRDQMHLHLFLRNRLLDAVGSLDGEKRCYIRRTGSRRVANEEELLTLLARYDFESMTPETLPMGEKFRYMTNAVCSIMPHGANTALTLLQKPRSTFIELFSHRYVNYATTAPITLLELSYHPLVERTPLRRLTKKDKNFFGSGRLAGICVDIRACQTILGAALRSGRGK